MRVLMILVMGSLMFCANSLFAIPDCTPNYCIDIDTIPKVFLLGEHEVAFEKLTTDHSTMLLSACDDDMDLAYAKWLGMIREMEAHSEIVNYDLKGIKLWINIFWEEDGEVSHLAYHLKPQSKNVNTEKLTLFMEDFLEDYTFPFTYDQKFSHYGSAAFPTMPRPIIPIQKKSQSQPTLAKEINKN